MKTKNLTQVSNITTGKLDANAEIPDGKFPFFTCAPTPMRINTFSFDDDVVLLAGNNAQGNFHLQRYKGKFDAYQRTYVITAKKGYDIDYIKYSLELSLQHLKRLAQGSQTKFLTMQILDSFQVLDVPYEEQKALISSVCAIDSKIRLNDRICSELETMAKTLYDYWFVQFDFPDENGKPYRTSGGEMVWNESLKRRIPKGWKAIEYSELVGIENSSINPSSFGKTVMEYYSIPAFDEDCMPTFDTADTIQSGKYRVLKESFLVSKLNPQFKRIWDPYCLTDNAICSTEFMVYKPKDIGVRPICYAIANSDGFYNHMVSKAISSTGSRKRIQPDVSIKYSIAFPLDRFIVDRFCSHYRPILEKIKKARLENYELKKLRDWLLPMLMNGQARVE